MFSLLCLIIVLFKKEKKKLTGLLGVLIFRGWINWLDVRWIFLLVNQK